ncbi:MAG: EscU/YscU/HrcU family type III secretion system export apparatus switch protein [Blastocatellia bacterium]|nr:EscU/YscU/HrcU family type III secretion system export apparatus switch protein [Blastocatellia bacterium]
MATDRTEKPTPKRREDARRKGQIARRPELTAAAGFLAGLAMLDATGADFLTRGGHLITGLVKRVADPAPLTIPAAHGLMIEAAGDLALLAVPVISAKLLAGVAANFAQGGLTIAPEAFSLSKERFNPAANLKRVFSADRLFELLYQFLVIGGIAAACGGLFARAGEGAAKLMGAPPRKAFTAMGEMLSQLGWRAGGVLLALAALDYGYGWYKHEKSLRMSRQELKDEFRQQEGDPMIKSQRRRAARALVQRQIIREVPRADVIVTNPTHVAVALKYDREAHAVPVVVAKGAELMAKRIREIAAAHKVPVIENPPLARALYRVVDVGGVIPPELFRAVAELLAYVYRQRNRAADYS